MSLRRFNLNMLPVLDAMLRHRNVTRAGNEIGLSQSAASHALEKLREHFGDDLLVRSGREMKLTHRAKTLAPSLDAALGKIEQLLDNNSFDPNSAVRNFKIGTADYFGVLILPELMRQIQTTSGLVVHIDWADRDVGLKLSTGELDLAIFPRGRLGNDVCSVHLCNDEFVLVAAVDNDRVSDTMDVDTFIELPYASVLREDSDYKSFIDRQLYQSNIVPRRRLVVSEFVLLPYLISQTSYVAIVPRMLADALQGTTPLKVVPLPFRAEPIRLDAYWSRLANADVGHLWLREKLFACRDRLVAARQAAPVVQRAPGKARRRPSRNSRRASKPRR